jgi:hypothetical protein
MTAKISTLTHFALQPAALLHSMTSIFAKISSLDTTSPQMHSDNIVVVLYANFPNIHQSMTVCIMILAQKFLKVAQYCII